jgi:hypothetical protein
VYEYRTDRLSRYRNAWDIVDSLSRTDRYNEAGSTIRFADRELARLSRAPVSWSGVGLTDELSDFLSKKKEAAGSGVGKALYDQAVDSYKYLMDLSNQTKMINAEMLLGKIDKLRSRLNIANQPGKKESFIGGMQPLSVGQDLEYWPFEGEYWEDELGGYVFNIGDACGKGK